jgi:hypothetical protein
MAFKGKCQKYISWTHLLMNMNVKIMTQKLMNMGILALSFMMITQNIVVNSTQLILPLMSFAVLVEEGSEVCLQRKCPTLQQVIPP